MVGRLIPFVAIAAANCINIPLMRQKEFRTGVPIYDQDQNQLGMSKVKLSTNQCASPLTLRGKVLAKL